MHLFLGRARQQESHRIGWDSRAIRAASFNYTPGRTSDQRTIASAVELNEKKEGYKV
jgi:hypothetical protein